MSCCLLNELLATLAQIASIISLSFWIAFSASRAVVCGRTWPASLALPKERSYVFCVCADRRAICLVTCCEYGEDESPWRGVIQECLARWIGGSNNLHRRPDHRHRACRQPADRTAVVTLGIAERPCAGRARSCRLQLAARPSLHRAQGCRRISNLALSRIGHPAAVGSLRRRHLVTSKGQRVENGR